MASKKKEIFNSKINEEKQKRSQEKGINTENRQRKSNIWIIEVPEETHPKQGNRLNTGIFPEIKNESF